MKIISTLPDNHTDVNAMKFQSMVQIVLDLTHPDTQIQGQAAMQINAFLAHAAVRMAKALDYSPDMMDQASNVAKL